MRKIGIMISKGGVGKSTTAVNLAAALAYMKYKTLLIDSDTQGNISPMLGIKPIAGLYEFLIKNVPFTECLVEARPNLHVLSGGYQIAAVKNIISALEMRREHYITDKLSKHDQDFDFIICDGSPGWDALSINLLFYVNELLIPVSVEVMTLRSLVNFVNQVDDVKKYNPDLTIKYLLPTFYDRRVAKSEEIYTQLKSHFGDIVINPIRYNVKLSECWGWGKTIYEYAGKSTGAFDYAELTKRVIKNEK